MRDETIGTIRTTYNTTLLTLVGLTLNKVFGWELALEDLTPYLPVIAAIVAVFYRASLVLSEIWPPVGYILFGHKTVPSYSVKESA